MTSRAASESAPDTTLQCWQLSEQYASESQYVSVSGPTTTEQTNHRAHLTAQEGDYFYISWKYFSFNAVVKTLLWSTFESDLNHL